MLQRYNVMSKMMSTPTHQILQQNLDLRIQEHLVHTSGEMIPMKIHTNEVTQFLFPRHASTSYHKTHHVHQKYPSYQIKEQSLIYQQASHTDLSSQKFSARHPICTLRHRNNLFNQILGRPITRTNHIKPNLDTTETQTKILEQK